MSRQKGTPKTGGRKAGTPNKVTTTLKEFIAQLLDENREQIAEDLGKLTPKDRLLIFERFMQYVIPKQKEVELTHPQEKEDYSFDDVPEDLLFQVADAIQDARAKRLNNIA